MALQKRYLVIISFLTQLSLRIKCSEFIVEIEIRIIKLTSKKITFRIEQKKLVTMKWVSNSKKIYNIMKTYEETYLLFTICTVYSLSLVDSISFIFSFIYPMPFQTMENPSSPRFPILHITK